MHYIMSLLNQMFEKAIEVVDVRRDVYEDYNERVDQAHARMIWTLPNVSGYYRNSRGRIVVNNPFRILEVWQMTEQANLADFHCLAASDLSAPGRQAVESSATT